MRGESIILQEKTVKVIPDKSGYINLSEIRIRDPYILSDTASETYYLFYNNIHTYCLESKDLLHWNNLRIAFYNNGDFDQNWAAEVHIYNNSYYLFTTLRRNESDKRGCYIFKSDTPFGPYEKWSERLTPESYSCIDGTLYVENEEPYMIYCNEYINYQDKNGKMCCVRLSRDLKTVIGDTKLLFQARDNEYSADGVTDAPFLYKSKNGSLKMLWSKYKDGKYAILSAQSENGILGPWQQNRDAVFSDDGGHAMIFPKFSGGSGIVFHFPNHWTESGMKGDERAVIYDLADEDGKLSVIC